MLATDKARALLAVGLARDAASELDGAMAAFRRQRLDYDLADAELARSEAALATGELAAASRWAAAAERRFRRRGNEARADLAALTRLRAQLATPGRRTRIAAEATRLAGRLRARGLADDADMAELITVRALAAAGRTDEATRQLAVVRRRGRTVPLDIACCAGWPGPSWPSGKDGPGRRWPSSGLAWPWCRRAATGSAASTCGPGPRRWAPNWPRPACGWRWSAARRRSCSPGWNAPGRRRSGSGRYARPPTRRPQRVLAELRQLSYLIREAELNGSRDPAMAARHAELRRAIREHDWQASGLGHAAALASLGDVSAALEDAAGRPWLRILGRDGQMVAVVVRHGSARLVRLGDFEAAAEAARRLSADLDTLAGRLLPARLETVIRESIRHQAATLTAEIVAPLRGALGDGGIVFVPAGPLAGIPWGVLPDLRGRPVTVCPSASSWLAAWRTRAGRGGPGAGPTAAAAGRAGPGARGPGGHRDRPVLSGLPPAARADRPRCAPRCRPWTAPRSPTWPRTGTTTRRTSCSPGSTWLTAR